jgi:NADH:ubiquinone reductase (H+-translocating)
VVIGAGFAGLHAVKALAGQPVEITIVDQHNFHTFLPLLYQVATAGLEPSDVAYPVRAIFGHQLNVTFRHCRVTDIYLDAATVEFADGSSVPYDYLVVATGAAAAFLDIPGASEHSRPLYTLGDARRLRNHILGSLEDADARPEAHDGGAPTFVIVGGGPTGVETAGALMELLGISVRRDRLRIDPDRTRVILLDAADRLLSGFNAKAAHYAYEALRARGVDVRLNEPVAEVTSSGVRLKSGEFIGAVAVIWAGGVTVTRTLAASLPGPADRTGRVVVDHNLSLAGHPEVFVVGDAAAVPLGPRGDDVCPQLAQVAIQSGRHAGQQILQVLARQQERPFSYRDKGIMATIGRRAAVAQLRGGLLLRGTIGWLAWLGLHLIYLIGFRNRFVVLINWAWRYFDWPSGPRVIVADVETEP